MKHLLLAIAMALPVLTAQPAAAAAFSVKRGLNLDIWVTWPPEEQWHKASALLPFPEWRRSVKADDLAKLKADGFDFLRMPVDPAPLLSERASGLRDRLHQSIVDSARLINAAGLNVVVDMHSIPWGEGRSYGTDLAMKDDDVFDAYVEMLSETASSLAGEDPAMVALEVMNEPTIECDPGDDAWRQRLSRLVAAARTAAPRLTLILPGGCWGSADGLSQIDPSAFPDDNLMWTFHSYDPFLLTTQGAGWAGDFIRYVTGLPYPLDGVPRPELDAALEKIRETIRREAPLTRRSGMLAYLDEQVAALDTTEKLNAVMDRPFDTVAAWAKQHAVAPENILLGEFGMIRQEYQNPYVMPAAWRAAYARDMIVRAETYGFPWSIWGYGGAFGVVEEFEGRKAEPDILDIIHALPTN